MKVLSIDDSKAIHAYMKNCFENEKGYQLEHAYNGEEGFSRAKEEPFDVILLDWEMPKMTGPEVLEKIRGAGIATPIIMVTTKNSTDDITEAIDKGATDYIMKPFTREILFEKIEEVV